MEDVGEYCRQLESYLCQKNGGHLVRIVGPAFEEVSGWARQGVPLKIACRGIDRYCERIAARSARRRPVRIEFCSADILEAFDEWRRALGVAASAEAPVQPSRKPSLASHVDRVIARLAGLHGQDGLPAAVVDRVITALDPIAAASRKARGDERADLLSQLTEIDASMMRDVIGSLPEARQAALRRESLEDLAAFGDRLTPDARKTAETAAYERLVRETFRLPRIAFD